jgi:hypothetical protein
MIENTSVGTAKVDWPSQDVQELLNTGCLMYRSKTSEIIIAQADCGHYTVGIGSEDNTVIWHLETFDELQDCLGWVNFDSMKYLSRDEFREVGELTFVDIRIGMAHISHSAVPSIVTKIISETLDRVLQLEDEGEKELEEIDNG